MSEEYTPEYIASLNLNSSNSDGVKNSTAYSPDFEGSSGGMSALSGRVLDGDVIGNIGLGSGSGISLGIEGGIDSVGSEIFGEGAMKTNLLSVFDGSVFSIMGLPKSECFAIKSLGVLTSLNNISALKQINLDIKGKTSIVAQGEQQH